MYPRQPSTKKVLLLTPVARAVMQAVVTGIPPVHVQQELTMKVSLGKFYHEVTGSNTGNHASIVPALKRWQIPFDETPGIKDKVDVAYLEQARAAFAKEEQERVARRALGPQQPKHGITSEQFQELQSDVKACSAGVLGMEDVLFQTNERIDQRFNRLEAKLDDIINRLSKFRR